MSSIDQLSLWWQTFPYLMRANVRPSVRQSLSILTCLTASLSFFWWVPMPVVILLVYGPECLIIVITALLDYSDHSPLYICAIIYMHKNDRYQFSSQISSRHHHKKFNTAYHYLSYIWMSVQTGSFPSRSVCKKGNRKKSFPSVHEKSNGSITQDSLWNWLKKELVLCTSFFLCFFFLFCS